MMLTLKTAKDMGIKNRLDPESSIKGGAQYFKKTLGRIDESITEPDNIWMAMAAYNVGYYHLQDARIITRKLNKDPNRWIDVRESLPLLAKRKWYKQTRYGYARGWEPVRYVENIRSYYDILKWVDEGDFEATPVPDEFLKIPNSL
jgi:membrane-bound lytic murein transglycosylase F